MKAINSQLRTESNSNYVTTDGQSASMSWCQGPPGVHDQTHFYCHTATSLFMRGTSSDESTGLSFTNAVGPRQRSHSHVRVPRDSHPYFTLSDYKPHPTFSLYSFGTDHIENIVPNNFFSQITDSSQSQSHVTTDGQSVSQSVCRGVKFTLEPVTRYYILPESCCVVSVGLPL
jgi:hypothetical protein